jgi:DNA modification methylase
VKQQTIPGIDVAGKEKAAPDYDILPVSVIDVAPQKKRKPGCHESESSRSGFSPFPTEIAQLCAEYFLRDSSVVFDPFGGWGERGEAVQATGKAYIGLDTSRDAVSSASEKGVTLARADSRVADIPEHDGLLTCPPYFNLETYAGDGIDKAASWESFCNELRVILARCWKVAAPGSTYCIMVGEWRKSHVYHDMEGVTRRIMADLGARMFDQVVVSRKKTSKIKIMLPQAKRLGYTVRVHESLLVYQKPFTVRT